MWSMIWKMRDLASGNKVASELASKNLVLENNTAKRIAHYWSWAR